MDDADADLAVGELVVFRGLTTLVVERLNTACTRAQGVRKLGVIYIYITNGAPRGGIIENGRFDIARSRLLIVLVSGTGKDILTRTSLPPRALAVRLLSLNLLEAVAERKCDDRGVAAVAETLLEIGGDVGLLGGSQIKEDGKPLLRDLLRSRHQFVIVHADFKARCEPLGHHCVTH